MKIYLIKCNGKVVDAYKYRGPAQDYVRKMKDYEVKTKQFRDSDELLCWEFVEIQVNETTGEVANG